MHRAVQEELRARGFHPAYHGSCQSLNSDDARSLNEQMQAMARRFEARFRSVDGRSDAIRSQVDGVRNQLSTKIEEGRRELRSLIWRTVIGGAVVVAALCLATVVLLT
jgi:hypothetical protein